MYSGMIKKKKKRKKDVYFISVFMNLFAAPPFRCFKGSFKLRLFATVNLFTILAAVKETF